MAVSVSSGAQQPAKRASCLCDKNEERFFSCQTAQHKSISVCARPDGLIQYRFGTRDKVELRYPESPSETLRYANYMRFQTENYEVSFDSAGATYSVFDYTEGREHSAGVRILKADGKEVTVSCTGRVFSRLNQLASRLPCDKDNALNSGGCSEPPK